MSNIKTTSYNNEPSEQCWHDDCNCETIPVADCDALVEENNKGVGRFACRVNNEDCYNKKFFGSFLKKLTCQLYHYIQNICALWDVIFCMRDYLKTIGDYGEPHTIYARNSAVSSLDFYHSMQDNYDIRFFMDSTTGIVVNESNDGRLRRTDRRYRVFIRWCADGTGLDPNADNTMSFTVHRSSEDITDEMVRARSLHWQMTGVKDGAMEMSDTLILEPNEFIIVDVRSHNSSQGRFRLHQFKIEYVPIVDKKELPECLKE